METTNQNETKDHEKRSDFQQILLFCLDLCTQNPVLREVGLKLSQKRGSDKINMLRQRRKNATENKSYGTAWTQ